MAESANGTLDLSDLQRETERTRERMTAHLNSLDQRIGTLLRGEAGPVSSPPTPRRSLVSTALAAITAGQRARVLVRVALPLLRSNRTLAAIGAISALVVVLRVRHAPRQLPIPAGRA